MRLATRANGQPDGELVVVSRDAARYLPTGSAWPNLLAAIGDWSAAEPALRSVQTRVDAGEGAPLDAGDGAPLDAGTLRAPLPRSWQWLDGSVFPEHARLMQVAFGIAATAGDQLLMYQGMSDRFLGPTEPAPFPHTDLGIDFEGEFGVVVDAVPMGTPAGRALAHVKLLVQINDWSLRTLALREKKTGFGFVQAKPACSMAPFAITPDELGLQWQDGRVCTDLAIDWNGRRFGNANGREMAVGFEQLIAHAAATRHLVAGTIIGSGTVSNADYATVGSSCIAERRAIETIAHGQATTPYMAFGDRVRMEARLLDGSTPFGAIDQIVVSA
jgi:fumarylacetoacetate (FAA) hydrolase